LQDKFQGPDRYLDFRIKGQIGNNCHNKLVKSKRQLMKIKVAEKVGQVLLILKEPSSSA
jgi:hypothetical protein